MKREARLAIVWEESELQFIRDNYYVMTWKELTQAIKVMRPEIELSAIRHQCIRMKLAKQVQIRWSKDDTQFPIDNHQTKGDKELAIDLNKFKRTFRVIDGKKVYRTFKKKHIEKKMTLLGLKRSIDEYNAIRKRNIQTGLTPAWSKENNVYTMGIKPVYPEGTIRIWGKKYKQKWIKIDGKFISYSRYQYEKYFAPLGVGYNVCFKDGDPMNCEPDNLYLVKDEDQSLERSVRKQPEELQEIKQLSLILNRQISNAIKKNENGTD